MNKKLFRQIINEWKSNIWIIAELLLVSIILWYIVDSMYVKISIYNQPRGFDISHCYLLKMGTIKKGEKGYVATDSLPSNDVAELLARLKRRPDIEAAGISESGYPYDESSRGMSPLSYDSLVSGKYLELRRITPGFLSVFRYEGTRGETPEELASLLSEDGNNFIASDNIFEKKYNISLKSLIGKKFKLFDTITNYKLAATYIPARISDYTEASSSCSVICLLPQKRYRAYRELCVRVKPDKDKGFMERISEDFDKQLTVNNIYVYDVRSFRDIRRSYQIDQRQAIGSYILGLGFLLLNIFLGLLGTFWFRTQERKGEIALMMALGGNKKSIFIRQITEGMLLLIVATIPAIIIDWNIAYAGLTESMDGSTVAAGRFIFTIAVT
ncbi:MAG: ABC transporter permease, partial [Bacteroidales bacterium]|nr:ABC transporter permease [Bacteroidales bacterium]